MNKWLKAFITLVVGIFTISLGIWGTVELGTLIDITTGFMSILLGVTVTAMILCTFALIVYVVVLIGTALEIT